MVPVKHCEGGNPEKCGRLDAAAVSCCIISVILKHAVHMLTFWLQKGLGECTSALFEAAAL